MNNYKKAHVSVLKKEIKEIVLKINPKNSIDFTFGAGGHSEIILENSETKLIGMDRDPKTKDYGVSLLKKYEGRFQYVNDISFNMDKYGSEMDFILGDLGISQMQLLEGEGFAYNRETPLSMAMGVDSLGHLNELLPLMNLETIQTILREYGEEKRWKKISQEIFYNRSKIKTSTDLKNIINLVVFDDYKCFSRCFQAFRIYINKELTTLEDSLKKAYQTLSPNGYLAIISFHSLEDRIVKNFFKENLTQLELIVPTEEEIKINNQSRSAKLRLGKK